MSSYEQRFRGKAPIRPANLPPTPAPRHAAPNPIPPFFPENAVNSTAAMNFQLAMAHAEEQRDKSYYEFKYHEKKMANYRLKMENAMLKNLLASNKAHNDTLNFIISELLKNTPNALQMPPPPSYEAAPPRK